MISLQLPIKYTCSSISTHCLSILPLYHSTQPTNKKSIPIGSFHLTLSAPQANTRARIPYKTTQKKTKKSHAKREPPARAREKWVEQKEECLYSIVAATRRLAGFGQYKWRSTCGHVPAPAPGKPRIRQTAFRVGIYAPERGWARLVRYYRHARARMKN